MHKVKHYTVEVMEWEYLFNERAKLLLWLEQKYGMNFSIKRSGPKMISAGRCHKELHHMVVHIKK